MTFWRTHIVLNLCESLCRTSGVFMYAGPSVLIYEISEKEQIVTLLDFEHPDNIYKR
jgi:hypothetical protein